MAERGIDFPLVHASAEDVPLPDASFDIVFCDHGAMSFAEPDRTVPEAARLLRSGGILAFSHASPFWWLCWNESADDVDAHLHRDYFDLRREDEADGSVNFQLPYGEWIRLFAEHGLVTELLVEPRPAEDADTTYGWNREWARRWPAEAIWRARKL